MWIERWAVIWMNSLKTLKKNSSASQSTGKQVDSWTNDSKWLSKREILHSLDTWKVCLTLMLNLCHCLSSSVLWLLGAYQDGHSKYFCCSSGIRGLWDGTLPTLCLLHAMLSLLWSTTVNCDKETVIICTLSAYIYRIQEEWNRTSKSSWLQDLGSTVQ